VTRGVSSILIYVKGHCCATFPQVTVEDHLKFVEVLRPDVFECLCDSSPSIGNKPKRIGKSVDRTLRFLDETVEARATNKVRRTITILVWLTVSQLHQTSSLIPSPFLPHSQSFPASFPVLSCLIPSPFLPHSQAFPDSSFDHLQCAPFCNQSKPGAWERGCQTSST